MAGSHQAALELSSSFINPKYIALSPFATTAEQQGGARVPSIPLSVYHFILCTRRGLNTRIIGFEDSPLHCCVENLLLEGRANLLQDPVALKLVEKRQRNTLDVKKLPWKARPEYVAWLERRGRLEEVEY